MLGLIDLSRNIRHSTDVRNIALIRMSNTFARGARVNGYHCWMEKLDIHRPVESTRTSRDENAFSFEDDPIVSRCE